MSEDPKIIGWAVFTEDIEHAAMFNLDQREQAFESAKRWGASISALSLHKASPAVERTRPTIAELERILQSDADVAIEILPNGEIRAKGGTPTEVKPITMRENLGGEYAI